MLNSRLQNWLQKKLISASFQIVWCIGMPKRILSQMQTYWSLYWKMKSSKQVYFINIRLFSRIFCKNRFYSFIRNLYRVLWSKHCIFSKIWPMLRYWHTSSHNNISHNNIFFKIVFASIISELKMCKTVQDRSGKKKKSKECCCKWKQGNFLFLW